jgi:hypothetical protein
MQQMMALPKWRAVVMARTMSIFAETVKPLVSGKLIKLSALLARVRSKGTYDLAARLIF